MSSSSREDSPDWLRHFQAPTQAPVTLSSDTESSPSDDEDNKNLSELFHKQVRESSDNEKDAYDAEEILNSKISKHKSLEKVKKAKQAHGRKRLRGEGTRDAEQAVESEASPELASKRNSSVWSLSSDSDTSSESKGISTGTVLGSKFPGSDKVEDVLMKNDEVATVKTERKQLKQKDNKTKGLEKADSHMNGNAADLDVEEDPSEKHTGAYGSSSRVPLVLSEKVLRSKVLVECEGDSIDLSGDVGAVGRVIISDESSENHEMLLDMKGTIYRTTIVPSRTFCVVSFGQSEAKIEAIMNDFVQLKPQSNVYEAETMVEGTLEGLLFDSEDEVENLPKTTAANQKEDAEEQSRGKTKRKADKASVDGRMKAKTAAGKVPRKGKRKSTASKKNKTRK